MSLRNTPLETQMVNGKVTALLASTSALSGEGVQLHPLAAIPLGKRPGAHYTGDRVVS
jgi:hypothetical protein